MSRRQAITRYPTRQNFTHYTAACFTCGESVAAKNALAWGHNHVSVRPGHKVEVSLGYIVSCEQVQP